MKKKSTYLQFLLCSVAIIILNALIFYYINCSGGVLQSKDVFGSKYTYASEEIVVQKMILNSLPSDMDVAEESLEKQIQDLAVEYENNPRFATSDEAYLAFQTAKRPYEAVLSQIAYIEGYPEYVLGIADNAAELLELPIYQKKGWLRNNIIQTQKDFYGLERMRLTPVTEAGYMSLLNYRITDVLVLLLTLGTVWMLAPSERLSARREYRKPLCIWLISICVMYFLNVGMTAICIGLPEFQVALQSLPSFQSCPYLISCGLLLIVSLFFKLAGFIVLLCLGFICFSCRKKGTVIGLFGLIVAELILSFCVSKDGIGVFLKEINMFSAFGVERFYLRYLNLDIGGQAVAPLPLFTVFMGLLVVVTLFVTIRRMSIYTQEIQKRAERTYYDELDRKYEETRKIRHDMNNHLLALNLLVEKGDVDSAKAYIGEISEELDKTIMPVRTGSNVLDALIWQKIRQARTYNIEIQTEVLCPIKDRNITDYDLCGIFGNILDNAIEAVAGMDNAVIRLSIRNQLNMLYISCENPYQGERRKSGEKYLTTKEDMAFHGLGINRIKEIVKAYDGEVSISDNQGNFQIEILLNSK